MKRISLAMLLLCNNATYAMQRTALLNLLGNERTSLTSKHIKDACCLLVGLEGKYEKTVLTKALWGLAAAWDDSFGKDGIEVAKVLLQAGANPQAKVTVEEVLPLKNQKESGFCYTSTGSYETTVLESAKGALKNYLNAK